MTLYCRSLNFNVIKYNQFAYNNILNIFDPDLTSHFRMNSECKFFYLSGIKASLPVVHILYLKPNYLQDLKNIREHYIYKINSIINQPKNDLFYEKWIKNVFA